MLSGKMRVDFRFDWERFLEFINDFHDVIGDYRHFISDFHDVIGDYQHFISDFHDVISDSWHFISDRHSSRVSSAFVVAAATLS
ncbi:MULTISPECIES: hypothetical protein [unclassified Lysinibacillus]|uniref:hypothetical protein n=1 Tax=unclassified Lysinibacillus TaxID=2636778 RepID=UPI0037F77831